MPDQILQSSHLDLLFESRNHAYGAYDLRKHYDQRLKKSLAIVFLFTAVISVVILSSKVNVIPKDYDTDPYYIPLAQPTEPVQPPSAKPRQQSKESTGSPEVSSKQTVQNKPTGSKLTFVANDPNIPIPGDDPVPSPGAPLDKINLPALTGDSSNSPVSSEPLDVVEQMPEFPGGQQALADFLRRHLNMPEGIQPESEVTVKVRFIVGFDGKLRGFNVVQDGGVEYNTEVLRVLKKMPQWTPGRPKGRDVAAYYVIPVRFVPPL